MKPDHYLNFAIGLALSMAVSFGLTIVFWKNSGWSGRTGTEMGNSPGKRAACKARVRWERLRAKVLQSVRLRQSRRRNRSAPRRCFTPP